MKIALLGATGNAGSRILDELLARGHAVTAIVRDPGKLAPRPGLSVVDGDANDRERLPARLAGHDAAISAIKFKDADPNLLIDAVRQARVPRYLVVGGAGSLWVAPGLREVDSPGFPAHVRPEALRGAEFLEKLKASDLDWTFLSPSRLFQPGSRTGKFRLGDDDLLVGADGASRISFEDYAVALVDELEQPRHSRRRFTVGY
ncbi:MAG: NAD(P)-dependent oxidoreductase [Pseudoxanthomonas sp.]